MTRYARGKGSKASNEKLPNEPTPWHVMKQQLEENKNKEPLEKKKGAKELLKDQESMLDNNTNENTWAEFEENNSKFNKKKMLKNFKTNKNDTNLTKISQNNDIVTPESNNNTKSLEKKKRAKELLKDQESMLDNNTNGNTGAEFEENSKFNKKKKLKNLKTNKNDTNLIKTSQNNDIVTPESNNNTKPLEKKRGAKELLKDQESMLDNNTNGNTLAEFEDNNSKFNKKKKLKNLKTNKNDTNLTKTSQNYDTVTPESNTKKLQKPEDTTNTTDSKKNKISNKKKQDIEESSLVEEKSSDPQNEACSNSNMLSKRQKRNLKRKLKTSDNESKFNQDVSSQNAFNKEQRIKKPKTEYKRRKPDVGVTKVIINGVEIEIVKFDGFPIKKEDAARLTELKQKLIMKGIPKSEVDTAMKLERRRAEKALARVKKLVCFNCRKSGHNLSDCPELDREETSTGICFKCGSTEHTHFECKVNREATYRFAKCFICHEQGHIALQCPDNPKGVYPHGGCCKVCGAVTHLKKDCPDLVNAKEDNAVTVEKMDNSAVESLQEDVKKRSNQRSKNKIVKF